MKKKIYLCVFLISYSITHNSSILHAEVVVHDMIAVLGKPSMLEAETRKGFFKKGGELVELFIDGKSIGRNLSGGDGLVYKEFTPEKTGLMRISAESGEDKGEGLLLVLRKGKGIVFIDVEGSIKDEQFSLRPKEGSKEAIEKIAKRFPIVYLQTGIIGGGIMKKWLKEDGFIEAPLVPWDNGLVFEEIEEMGLKVNAVIGSPSVIDSAAEFSPKAFTFEEDIEDAETVDDWKEIEKKLKK